MTETETTTETGTVDHVPGPPTGNGHDAIAIQEQLLPVEVPEYHGRPAVGMKTSVKGAGNRITRPHELGARTVLLVEVKLTSAGHEEQKDGIVYAEGYTVVDLFELPAELGHKLLVGCRRAYRTKEDGQQGDPPDPGARVTVDGSGNVVTDAERRAMADGPDDGWVCLDCGADRDPEREGGPDPHGPDCPDAAEEARADVGAADQLEQARTAPWAGYDEASRTTLLNKVAELDDAGALEHVARYEGVHKNRKTVLDAVAARLAKIAEAA